MTNVKNWQSYFKQDVKNKFIVSQEEFEKYKHTSSIIYLQQACEKMFSVVENYFMIKYEYRAKSYGDLYAKVRSNSNDVELLRKAFQLHQFFYNGEVQMPKYIAEDEFIHISLLMKSRIKRIS